MYKKFALLLALYIACSAASANEEAAPGPQPVRARAETPPIPSGSIGNIDAEYSYFVQSSQQKTGLAISSVGQIEQTAARFARRRDYEKQLELLKISLQVHEQVYGVDSLECLRVHKEIIQCLMDLKREKEAVALQKKIVRILDLGKRKIVGAIQRGSDPPSVEEIVQTYLARGDIYVERNDTATAIKYFKKALEVEAEIKEPAITDPAYKVVMRRKSKHLQETLERLAIAYEKIENLSDAIAAYKRLLPLHQAKTRGEKFAIDLNTVARLSLSQKKTEQAKEYYSQAISLDTKYSGVPKQVAIAKLGLARILLKEGDVQKARELFEQVEASSFYQDQEYTKAAKKELEALRDRKN